MKKVMLLAALATSAVVPAFAQAGDSYSITLDFPYVSKYVFRGQELAKASIQPSIEATVGDFYAGIWTSNAIGDASINNEVDYYVGYNFALNDTWKLDAGATFYAYPDAPAGVDDQFEPFLGINGTVGGVSTTLYGYYETDSKTWTGIGTLGYSFPLADAGTSLDFTATLGYVSPDASDDYWYYGVGVAVPYKISDKATFKVGLDWVDNNLNNSDDSLWFTVDLSIGM